MDSAKLIFQLLDFIKAGDEIGVEHILHLGVSPNLPNNFGPNPLALAIETKHPKIALFLLKKDATPNIQAFTLSAQNNYLEIIKFFVEEKKFPIDTQNEKGETALICASQKGSLNVVKFLLEQNANPNIQEHLGNSALLFAVQNRSIDIVKILLLKNADPNISNHEGTTPLLIAVENNETEAVTLLLEKKADITVKKYYPRQAFQYECHCKTLLQLAQKNKNTKIITLLKSAGAKE